ncbi:MAG: ribonuclease III domain-containing protein [Eubacteriales bacterium]|nr:ribonuclease III domain-containing protein [Eubacteriales bacterium]
MDINPKTADTTAFAYMGDAVYEVYIRRYVIESTAVKNTERNAFAIGFVKADSQAEIIRTMLREEFLTEEEIRLVKRARNRTNTSRPRGSSPAAYKWATGFEALIGWLYLSGDETRLLEVERRAVEIHEAVHQNTQKNA